MTNATSFDILSPAEDCSSVPGRSANLTAAKTLILLASRLNSQDRQLEAGFLTTTFFVSRFEPKPRRWKDNLDRGDQP